MKHITLSFVATVFLFTATALHAQDIGGPVEFNPDNLPCLSAEDYSFYHEAIRQNIASLEAQGKRSFDARSPQDVAFAWPVRKADDINYNDIWAISNYVDHNPSTNALEDWNCGARTYDTSSGYDHQGLDIYTWPFWWTQMDNEQSHVVAAAAGQIVFKNDGSPDRSCELNGNQWNAIYVEHSDGSIAWYGHMKNGSLNSKNVGDSVVEGEILGVIGSSGNSTGPHLHFEVYNDAGQLIDPYAGPCNDLNSSSWWQDQKPYVNPGVNAALTHTAAPEFFNCPTAENPNVSEQFDANATIFFGGYFRDQQIGDTAINEIYDPSGNLFSTWNNDFVNFYYSSYWVTTRTIGSEEGLWRYVVSYNGETAEQTFRVGELSLEEEALLQLQAYPNPTQNSFELEAAVPIKDILVRDALGRTIIQQNDINNIKSTVDLTNFASGMYFVSATTLDAAAVVTLRIIKQ